MRFKKMNGLGNDFVIVDGVKEAFSLGVAQIIAIADREKGVGCDQFIVMAPPQNSEADVFMRIYNPDGSQAEACGNATRCVAWLYMEEYGCDHCVVETVAGLLPCRRAENDMITVDMGVPEFDQMDINGRKAGIVNIGNPHCVFFVDDVDALDIAALGAPVEKHPLFPQRTNVEFAQVMAPDKIRMRVWERGAGITKACGSGACATIVAGVQQGLSDRKAEIMLDGGSLFMQWDEQTSHIFMTGPVAMEFEGVLPL